MTECYCESLHFSVQWGTVDTEIKVPICLPPRIIKDAVH